MCGSTTPEKTIHSLINITSWLKDASVGVLMYHENSCPCGMLVGVLPGRGSFVELHEQCLRRSSRTRVLLLEDR